MASALLTGLHDAKLAVGFKGEVLLKVLEKGMEPFTGRQAVAAVMLTERWSDAQHTVSSTVVWRPAGSPSG